MTKKKFLEFVGDHLVLLLVGQLLCLVGICITAAVVTDSFWLYLIITGLATALFSLTISIFLVIIILPNTSNRDTTHNDRNGK